MFSADHCVEIPQGISDSLTPTSWIPQFIQGFSLSVLTGDDDDDIQCEESDCDDWDKHFAEVHAINTQVKIVV